MDGFYEGFRGHGQRLLLTVEGPLQRGAPSKSIRYNMVLLSVDFSVHTNNVRGEVELSKLVRSVCCQKPHTGQLQLGQLDTWQEVTDELRFV